MPQISPLNHTFTKKVNDALEISLTYKPVPLFPEKFDCILQLSNTHRTQPTNGHKTRENGIDNSTENSEYPTENGESNTATPVARGGWLSSIWGSEKTQLVEKKAPDVPLLLGYIQMLGHVRLNHQIGAETGTESASSVFWRNSEYTGTYCSPESDDKVQQILHTKLFKETGGDGKKHSRLEGIPDLHAQSFDATAHYLLHDLAHPFGTMDMPKNGPDLTVLQQEELSSSLSRFVVPFYVTAQNLVFASKKLTPGEDCVYQFRVNVPPEHLPPSYNTKSTGSVGEAGLASISYSFIVGFQEESESGIKHRAVYFPMELRTGHYGLGRSWLQHDYLRETVVDREWKPEEIGAERGREGSGRKEGREITEESGKKERHGVEKGVSANDGGAGSEEDKFGEVSGNGKSGDISGNDKSGEIAHTDKSGAVCEHGRTGETNGSASSIIDDLFAENTSLLSDRNQHSDSSENPPNDSPQHQKPTETHRKESLHTAPKSTQKDSFLKELDSLIEGSLETVAAKERRKSSVSYNDPADRGLLSQLAENPRVSYQIRVNNHRLCVLTMSSSTYHVGDDVHFFLKLNPDVRMASRVVGFTAHVEAHEIFHVAEDRKVLNIYKVSPTVKANTYADALMFPFREQKNTKTGSFVNLPRFLTQQFQASTFMDLRYFMVFRFVLNEFPEMESYRIDDDPKAFAEYVSAYKLESEANEFRFSIPLTVLP